MRKLLTVLALVVSGTACQHSTPASQITAVAPATSAALPKPSLIVQAPALPDSLTSATKELLQRVDLTQLLTATAFEKEANYQPVLDGFFDTNPQRLSLTILQATRDSLRPGRFWVMGKTRFKRQISRFEGVMQLVSLSDYYEQGLLLSQGNDKLTYVADSTLEAGGYIANARAYSATASFRFNSPAPAAYVLTGQALLDFWVTDKGVVGFMNAPAQGEILEKAPTKGSGLVLRGSWQDIPSKLVKPFLVSQNIFLLSPGLISDFGVGERSAGVNPKYAKLGWASYWQNDEWWADSPKPSLSL
jgi:hypothetical protein